MPHRPSVKRQTLHNGLVEENDSRGKEPRSQCEVRWRNYDAVDLLHQETFWEPYWSG